VWCVRFPGYDVRMLDDEGKEVAATHRKRRNQTSSSAGMSLDSLEQRRRLPESYFDSYPGYYKTGDAGFKDDDGYLWIMGRTDDIINVAGHRLSTGGMEEVIAAHPDVAECAVIGKADALKGEVPLGLVVLKAGTDRSEEEIVSELIAMVRERIGPVASFKSARVVNRLPKTRSGKIVRGTIKKIADGVDYQIPATIEDATVLDEIKAILT
jgi:propionyl-CoA synthetase